MLPVLQLAHGSNFPYIYVLLPYGANPPPTPTAELTVICNSQVGWCFRFTSEFFVKNIREITGIYLH
jgi:hypothetical protein